MYSSPLSLNTHDSIAQDTKITQEKRNEPRLVIDRLVLTDFKSYAGKSYWPVPFIFSAVVGPNGSGKSNVIDSMLFVLGLGHLK